MHLDNVGDFTISYDLISAYHRIEIFQENQQYFGSPWFFFKEKHTIFRIRCSPFWRFSTASYIF
jgi:hypothetical protein